MTTATATSMQDNIFMLLLLFLFRRTKNPSGSFRWRQSPHDSRPTLSSINLEVEPGQLVRQITSDTRQMPCCMYACMYVCLYVVEETSTESLSQGECKLSSWAFERGKGTVKGARRER